MLRLCSSSSRLSSPTSLTRPPFVRELRHPEGADVLYKPLRRPVSRRKPRADARGSSLLRQVAGRRRWGARRRRTSRASNRYNVFNRLHTVFPVLHFEGAGERFRGGRLRVLASSQHPIALSVLFVVLLPLVIYLARRVSRRWTAVVVLYVVAIFSTASRTGIVGLLVLVIIYLCLQPRAVLRAWPAVIPLLAVVHVAGARRDRHDSRNAQPEHR